MFETVDLFKTTGLKQHYRGSKSSVTGICWWWVEFVSGRGWSIYLTWEWDFSHSHPLLLSVEDSWSLDVTVETVKLSLLKRCHLPSSVTSNEAITTNIIPDCMMPKQSLFLYYTKQNIWFFTLFSKVSKSCQQLIDSLSTIELIAYNNDNRFIHFRHLFLEIK